MVRISSGQGQISSGQVISYHVSVRSCHVRLRSVEAEVKVMQVRSGQVSQLRLGVGQIRLRLVMNRSVQD